VRQSSVKSAVIPTPRNEVEVEVIEEALRNWSALFSMLNVHDDTAELIGNVSGLVAGGKTVARKRWVTAPAKLTFLGRVQIFCVSYRFGVSQQ